MSYYLGIDSSTTATKALLMDAEGQLRGVASTEYGYETPRPMWTEQDPGLWWEATAVSIRRVLAESQVDADSVRGVGLTGQMHGLVLLDSAGEVLRPAILWNDQRTGAECDEIRERLGKDRLIQITGNDALTGFTAPKILWVRNHEPDIYTRVRHILLPKDYVRFKLTGDYASDRAGGAGTLLFDVRQRDWSPVVLETLEIDPAWLPPTFEGTAVTGRISPQAAEVTGLRPGTPVVGGGGDQAAGAVGTGAVVEGIVSLSLGTSGVVFAASDRPIIEPEGRLHAFCHAVPGKWHLMGVMLSAAGSLRWYRDALAPGVGFDTLVQPASNVKPGSDGLYFLPYLTGERTPYPDPLARGAFVGLTVRHDQAHLTRAVLEGVAYGLRDSFELMLGAGLPGISQVRITGGGARSAVWRQILADVLQVELVTVNTTEGAAYGAAVLAATGTGVFPDVPSACAAIIRSTGVTEPGPAVDAYQEMYPIYRGLYPALRQTFNAIAM
jgi:xylulokinase